MAHKKPCLFPLQFQRPVIRSTAIVASTWSDQMVRPSNTRSLARDFGGPKEAYNPDIGSYKTGFDPHFLLALNQNHFPSKIR